MPRSSVVSCALIALIVWPAAAEARTYTIGVDATAGMVRTIGPFHPRRDATPAAAIRAFGVPTVRREARYGSCRIEWSRLNLRIDFVNFGGAEGRICDARGGFAQTFVARGRAFRTRRGLRPGMPTRRVERLHPAATFRRGSWWLATFVSPFGDNAEYPALRATVRDGRVFSLAGSIGAAGE